MANSTPNGLAASLGELFKSGAYSDFIVTCNGETFKVHQAIVAHRSGFFAGAIRFPGKESNEGNIDLLEDDPTAVKLMLQFLYEDEYEPRMPPGTVEATGSVNRRTDLYAYDFPHTCGNSCWKLGYLSVCPHHRCGNQCVGNCRGFVCPICYPASTSPPPDGTAAQLLTHSRLYELADKYDIDDLKDLAKAKLTRACNTYWNDADFVLAARHVFTSTPEDDKGLRDVVFKTVADHMSLLNKPEVEALMMEFNGFAVALLKMRAKELGWLGEEGGAGYGMDC